MAYNIVLANPQVFSPGASNIPSTNGWEFNPNTPLDVYYKMGEAVPAPINIATKIKNYISELPEDLYEKIVIFISANNRSRNFFNVTGDIISALPLAYELTENNLNVITTITLKNLSLFTEGVYEDFFNFDVYGLNGPLVAEVLIETITYKVRLNVLNPQVLETTLPSLNFSFVRGGSLPPAKSLGITSLSTWQMVSSNIITATGSGVSNVSVGNQTILQGTGNNTLNVVPTSQLNTVFGSSISTEMLFVNNDGFSASVKVAITILESNTFIFSKDKLSFFAIKNLKEATPLKFLVNGFSSFTLSAPSWLVLSDTSGNRTGEITATPIIASNLSEGLFTGNIILKDSNNNEYSLPVRYEVAGTVYSLLDDGMINFTEEPDYLSVHNVSAENNDKTRNVASLTLEVTTFNYATFTEVNFNYNYLLPFFQDEAKLHIGEIITRLFRKPVELLDFGFNQNLTTTTAVAPVYRPALVNIGVEVINKDTNTVLYEKYIEGTQFVAGLKPLEFTDNKCILSKNEGFKRVTPNSKEIISFLIAEGYFAVQTQVNNDDAETVFGRSAADDDIFRYFFDFSKYLPGDVVRIYINCNGKIFSKGYKVISEGQYSNHIAFVNSFNCLELLECTGDIVLETDFKKENVTYYRNLTKVIENVTSSKTMKLTVVTGAIFRKNQTIVDAIIDSGKAWLIRNGESDIELVPKAKKFNNYDSDEELYGYVLEFDINRKKDGEVYLF
ncbi:hypothetical protein JJL45_05085 [Tamlana sp. s12]|uniref:hypothetical protein n=1 Tax=Tamlana sp. s12 TaxID=1630406 RepID=UPI0007FE43DB|nr:hypothetical protein [Tamlana sp. s12]OBQ56121.1 hypothetical protein VQ01_06970 [Tamlana sp. s12]QQY83365.1 hypothetical protein JJL45_05085 [Tamlana sp. s12]